MLNGLTRNYTTLVKPTTHLRKRQIREHELASILCVWSIHLGAGRKEWVTLDLLYVALFNPHCCCKWKEFPGSFQEEETKYQKAVPLLLVIRWGFKYVMVRFQALCHLLVSWMSPATNFPVFSIQSSSVMLFKDSHLKQVWSLEICLCSLSSHPPPPNLPQSTFPSPIGQYLFPKVLHSPEAQWIDSSCKTQSPKGRLIWHPSELKIGPGVLMMEFYLFFSSCMRNVDTFELSLWFLKTPLRKIQHWEELRRTPERGLQPQPRWEEVHEVWIPRSSPYSSQAHLPPMTGRCKCHWP